MSLPTFLFEVGFGAQPFATTPTYTDLVATDKSLESFSMSRGRQTEDDTAATGTFTATLLDDSRKYDATNAAGPYYPNIKVMTPVRVRATLDATTYKVFRGWIDPQNGWLRGVGDPHAVRVTVPVNDMLELYANAGSFRWLSDFGPVLTGQLVEDSFLALTQGLVTGGDPFHIPDWIDCDAGQELTPIWATLFGGTAPFLVTPLTMLRLGEITDPGFVYVANTGALTFRDRRSRQNATSQVTIYDKANFPGSGVMFDSATTRRNNIVNDATVQASSLAAQEYVDSASAAQYSNRAKSYSTGHSTTAAAMAMAQWIVGLKKDSYQLLDSLTLVPGTDSAVWLQILTREINDRITVVRTPENTGAVVTEDYFIEGISLNHGPGPDASCTWRLSAAGSQFDVWHAGTVGKSEAGTKTRAGY